MSAADPRVALDPQSCVRGDPFTWTVTIQKTSVTGVVSAFDLTTLGTTWTAKARSAADNTTSYAFTVNATNAATGILVFSLTGAQTQSMGAPGKDAVLYHFDIQVTGGNPTPYTPFINTLTIYKNYTY